MDSWLVTRIKAFVSRLSLVTETFVGLMATTDLDAVATERSIELAEVGGVGGTSPGKPQHPQSMFKMTNPLHGGEYETERRSSIFLEALEEAQVNTHAIRSMRAHALLSRLFALNPANRSPSAHRERSITFSWRVRARPRPRAKPRPRPSGRRRRRCMVLW